MPRENEKFEDFLKRIYTNDIYNKDENDIDVVAIKTEKLADFVALGEFENAVKTSAFEVDKLVSEIRKNLMIAHTDFHEEESEAKKERYNNITVSLTDTLGKLREIQRKIRAEKDNQEKETPNSSEYEEAEKEYQDKEDDVKHDETDNIPRARKEDETDETYNAYLADFYDTKMIEVRGFDYITEQYDVIQKQRENLNILRKQILTGNLSDEEKEVMQSNYNRIKSSIDKRESVLEEKTAAYTKKRQKEQEQKNKVTPQIGPGESLIVAPPLEKKKEQDKVISPTTVDEQVKDHKEVTDTPNHVSNSTNIPRNVVVKKKRSGISKKTLAWMALGLTAGVAVGFTVGPAGIMIANIAAGLGKAGLAYAANKIEEKQLEEVENRINSDDAITLPATVLDVQEPSNALKANLEKFKKYIKSPEGLRDISKGLTAFMVGTSIGRFAQNQFGSNAVDSITNNSPQNNTPQPSNSPQANNAPQPEAMANQVQPTDPYADIRVGDSVNGYNVSSGHDTASWAVNNTNSESLLHNVVDGQSTFKRFAIPGEGGQWQMINDSGMSITDVCAKYGLEPSQIAVDIGKNGASQAWVSVDELLTDAVTHSL